MFGPRLGHPQFHIKFKKKGIEIKFTNSTNLIMFLKLFLKLRVPAEAEICRSVNQNRIWLCLD